MSQYDDQPGAELLCCVLDAANLRGSDNVAGDPDYKQVAYAAIEYEFCWNARIGTRKNDGKGVLWRCRTGTMFATG